MSIHTPPRARLGILAAARDDVPGSVLLCAADAADAADQGAAKRSRDGRFVLVPQPDDAANDPLTWPLGRRNAALGALGLFCMLGGGMTPLLAAGFDDVARAFAVPVARVSLTTGLYMLGLGLGGLVVAPTALLWGKRPCYLGAAAGLIVTAVWCALAPSCARRAAR